MISVTRFCSPLGLALVVMLLSPARAHAQPPGAAERPSRLLALSAESAAAVAAGAGSGQAAQVRPAAGAPTPAVPLRLTLHDAIARGLTHNLAALLSEQRTRQADAARWSGLSGILPNVNASLMGATEKINLEAYGFPVAPGQSPLIGPFNVSDRRLSVEQTLFSWSAIEQARSGSARLSAAQYAHRDVREQIVVGISAGYLQLIATRARIRAAHALLETAIALETRAQTLKDAGVTAGVESVRAKVQTAQERQRVLTFENDFEKQKLQFARAIGLPLDQPFELADAFPYRSLEHMSPADAIVQALATRPDYKAALESVRAAEFSRTAAVSSMLPSVALAANVGLIGQSWSSALKTYSFVVAVHVPVFQAGRERARIIGTDAALQQDRAQLADLRTRIEYEVRAALLDVDSADQRVQVAQRGFDLATLQLTQAQDRFAAGVATHVEVIQAQEAVATAAENLIASQFAHGLAKGALARALGVAETSAERFLGGQQ